MTTEPDVNGPAGAEIIDVSGRTVLPGLIDCHDHHGVHGYDLATALGHRRAAEHPDLAHRQGPRADLGVGYTAVRDAGGLDAGFKRAIDEGLDRGAAARRLAVHHLADRRDRRPRQPVRVLLLRAARPAAARRRRQQPGGCPPGGPPGGAGRRRRHQMRDDRRRQLARPSTARATAHSISTRCRR